MATKLEIQAAIADLVEFRMKVLDCKLQDIYFTTQCGLINPGCPDDLCILPRGHVGTPEGYHVTGTCAYHDAIKFPTEWITRFKDVDVLIEEGSKLAQKMWPEDKW